MRFKLFLLGLTIALSSAFVANAATLTLDMQANGGNWQLFGKMSDGDNGGLASVSIPLLNVSTVVNRLPFIAVAQPNFDSAGFSEIRSAADVPILTGGLELVPAPSANVIHGLGLTAGSFEALGLTPATTSEQIVWGAPLLLAEGTYADTLPAVDLQSVEASVIAFENLTGTAVISAGIELGGGEVFPPVVDDLALFNDVLGGSVNGVVTGTDVDTWEETLEFVSYTPGYGAGPAAEGTLPALAGTWSAASQTFDWDTTGSYPGDYLWRVTGTNADGSDTGVISVAHRIPEPATLSLFGLALLGFVGAARRRS